MSKNRIYFQNSKGDKLCGILENRSGDKTRPVIIIVHGFASNKDRENFVKTANILSKANISSLRFDIWGHGESKGNFEDITITEAVDDILQAIKFLKNEGYKKIGLEGSSFGGIASIMAASKTPDLFVLALKSPVSNYEEKELMTKSKQELDDWKGKGYKIYENEEGKKFKLNYSFYEDFKNNNGYEVALSIKIPTIIVHGNADKTVPISQSIKTSKLIPNCKLVTIKGADHRYTDKKHAEQMIKEITDFIIEKSN